MSESNEDSVQLFEVGPRDGLQNESAVLEVDQKVEMIERLVEAGLRDIEVGSFVHPTWVPQMAETDEVVRRLDRRPEVNYWGLVPNQKGLERALEVGLTEIATFMSASETHNQENVNRSIEESLACLKPSFQTAKAEGCTVRAYVSTAFGCPYEGEVDFDRVMDLAETLLASGADTISLGDTIGAGTPQQVRRCSERVVERFGADKVALHLHDTQGLALTNAFVGYEAGIRTFDASVGATGGCPYAPGAAGNVGTEEMVRLFESMDVETGVDLEQVLATATWIDETTAIDIRSDLYQYRKELEGEETDCVA